MDCIRPDWPAPETVQAFTTTRKNGYSAGSYASLNLAQHVEDDHSIVERNRDRLIKDCDLPAQHVWLQQTHSNTVIKADDFQNSLVPPEADASWTSTSKVVCAVLTADCLPVFFTNKQGDRVASTHAGWRGALNGIISESFLATGITAEDCLVWLGPAIGAENFEVGADVYDALITKRVYKPAFPHEKAMSIIREGKGQHFDPDIVDALNEIECQFISIAAEFSDELYDNHREELKIESSVENTYKTV